MKTLCVAILTVMLFLVLPPASAYAQEPPTDALVGFIGTNFGGHLFGDEGLGDFDEGNPKAYGLSLLFWGPGVIAGELDFGYNPEFFGPADEVSDNNLLTLTGSVLIGPTIGADTMRARPYVVIGGGLMRSKISEFADFSLKDTNNRGVFNIGGGLYYYFVRNLGVRGDFRFFRGVGANDSDDEWGFIENWDYYRGSIGVAIAF